MNKQAAKNLKYRGLICAAFIVFTFFAGGNSAMALEEVPYSVASQHGAIEIRTYPPVLKAEVKVTGNRDEAINAAFRILFAYISGNNRSMTEIPMTAPVSQSKISEEIDMTAPVTQEETAQNEWVVAFYLPKDMTLEDAPKPSDSRVTLKEVEYGDVAVIRFSGTGTENNIEKHDAILKDFLKTSGRTYNPQARMLAFYNSPFTLWFLRRNEVLYPLIQEE